MFYQVDSNLTQYIRITLSCSPRAKEFLSHMASCQRTLKKIDSEIKANLICIKKAISNAIEYFPSQVDRSKYSHLVCFVIHKYFNLFMKYQGLLFSRLNLVKKKIDEFKELISSYSKQNIPIQIQFPDFLSSILKNIDPTIPKTEFKLKSLYSYLNNIPNIEKFKVYSNLEMFEYLKKLSTDVDIVNEYISPNEFDVIFESYIESNQDIQNKFYQIISYDNNTEASNKKYDMPKINLCKINDYNIDDITKTKQILNNFGFFINAVNRKIKRNSSNSKNNSNAINSLKYKDNEEANEFDFNYFEYLVQKVYIMITECSKIDEKMFIVLRCAALRFLCNKYYIIHNNEWIEKQSNKLIQNYIKIVNQTPRDMKISKNIIPSNLYDTKFETILKEENFKNAIHHMSYVQFLTCPIDIWNVMQNSIVCLMKGTSKLTDLKFYIPNIAFDDFFSIILPVFASAEIMSPNGLHSFVSYFMSIPKTNGMDITAASTIALSEFVHNDLD